MTVLRRLLPVAAILGLVAAAPAQAARPLKTAIVDPQAYWAYGVDENHNGISDLSLTPELAFDRVRGRQGAGAGAGVVRLYLYWNDVAPSEPDAPRNPLDPAYTGWADYDRMVRVAAENDLEVLFTVLRAPPWAEGPKKPAYNAKTGVPQPGTWKPDAVAFGQFASAAATRYSGSFTPPGATSPLPRVRLWQAWNEPNRRYYLYPQANLAAAARYRMLLRQFASGIRAVPVVGANVVVSAGLAPYGNSHGPSPLTFMRRLFCLDGSRLAACRPPVPLDVWSHHPYTLGGPTHHAVAANDVALGDLPQMRRVLLSAFAKGRLASGDTRAPDFWVTEWNWDSNPPDRCAISIRLHARWISEALYRMWRGGVTLAAWTQLRDYPRPRWSFNGGLYTWGGDGGARDKPKLSLRAFRFPFVAFSASRSTTVWGRTPLALPGPVLIQRRAPNGTVWRTIARVTANQHGIFVKGFRTPLTGSMRARLSSKRDVSVPFSLRRVADVSLSSPFGC